MQRNGKECDVRIFSEIYRMLSRAQAARRHGFFPHGKRKREINGQELIFGDSQK